MVCGAGIAGIQAALDLAESGFKVYLVDSAPAIGGRMAQLDKTFPTGDCAMCILSPKLVECARNKNIEIITLADVQGVSGGPGNFKVKILQNPRYIDLKKCDACGNCSEACPVNLPNEFERGLGTRKAVFRSYPQAIPNVFSISKSSEPAPCKACCPAGINVQGYVALTVAGKIKEAYELIRERCALPATLGRVCPHPCEKECNRREIDDAVSAREVERFIADYMLENPEEIPPWAPPAGLLEARVAVVGSGPAGLTAAADLATARYNVTLFEEKAQLGGMLRYGIPSYRLPKCILDKEIEQILRLGVEVKTNTSITKPKELLIRTSDSATATPSGFDAVFLATGAWLGRRLNIPGEDAPGVLNGLSFLNEVNSGKQPRIGPEVLVIGGDDLAIHAARCALRLPGVKSVHLACLEGRSEMPAHSWELAEALEEGLILHNGLGPTRFETDADRVASVTFRACTSVFDEYRRFDPLFDDTQISSLSADTVIVAVGRGVNASRFGVEMRPGGRIQADRDNLATSIKGVFAGGDAVLGSASTVEAVNQGHRAAEAIDAYIRGAALIRSTDQKRPSTDSISPRNLKYAPNPKPDASRQERNRTQQRSVVERLQNFSEISQGYSRGQALSEAARCLSCGLCSECMECVKTCSAGAVLHNQQPVELEIEAGSIILAPGVEEFQASLWKEYGHGINANVLSNVQFERMLSATGPTGGRVQRPSDGKDAGRIAFIQCIGSRDAARDCGYCSSICCMSAVKEAMAAFENSSARNLEVSIFCSDVRAFGKEFDSYVQRARDQYDVKFIHTIPSRVSEVPNSKNLLIRYTDSSGVEKSQECDLVVLSAGIRVPAEVKQMASRLGITLNHFGFAATERFSPMSTNRPGIYVAGAFQEPKDIPESVAQGSAAAACAMNQLTAVRGTMVQRNEYPWERDVSDEPPRIGVFVCHCGHNIAAVVDVDWVARKAAKMPDVFYAEANTYTCSDANQQHIRKIVSRHRLNRLVIASCSSRTHEMLFQETLRQSGLNKYLVAMTNIRDQCSWVHRDDPAAATAKAVELVSMAVARARHLKAVPLHELPVTAAALILGGGVAGMTAALNLAGQGFKVLLVEREAALGGLVRKLHATLEHADIQAFRRQLEAEILSHASVSVYLNSRLVRTSGQVGNFTSVLDVAGREIAVEHGVVIVATGGREKTTDLFLHGRDSRVITQSRLESLIAGGTVASCLGGSERPTIVMIQCVESRTRESPYCSRVCCSEAIKNAIELKRILPESDVVILGRDFRTYGFRESILESALEKGVRLVRYAEANGPVIVEREGRLEVKVRDALTPQDLLLSPELVVLSTGIAPGSENETLSGMLRSALTSEGFFMEAHSKLRPVDLANEGQYVCGLAHSPRFIDETIAQAQAAAARASAVLSKSQLEIMAQVARVDPANCVACATCVKICPFGAPAIGEIRKAEIQSAKCTGCGSCVAACPARTITLQHQESETVSAMLDELLVGGGHV
jgi:heterodisulfide reductase subunit A-like polyferredoxin